MSYADFIGSVSHHVQNRVEALDGETAAPGEVFWERLNDVLANAQASVEEGMVMLESEDSGAFMTLSAEFDLFVALHPSHAPDDDPSWWARFSGKAKAVLDSLLEILGDWLSDGAKRAILLLKELLDLLD